MAGVCRAWHGGLKHRQTPRCASQALRLPITLRDPPSALPLHTQPSPLFCLCTIPRSANGLLWLSSLHGCIFETVRVSVQHSPITRLSCITHFGTGLLTVYGRYGIAGLKALARSKFADDVELHLSSAEFPEACQEAYESTFHTDRGLRDVIIQTFRANPSLSLRPDVEMAVRETPGLAFELFRMASGLPVSS